MAFDQIGFFITFAVMVAIIIVLMVSRMKMSEKLEMLNEGKMNAESELQIIKGLNEGHENKYEMLATKFEDVNNAKMTAESELQVLKGLNEGHDERYKMIAMQIIKSQNDAFKAETTSPMMNTVSTLSDAIKDLQKENAEHKTRFTSDMENLSKTANNMMRETSVLSDVLKNSQKRGRYAEIGLERVFEMSNLIKGVHYTTQETIETGQRPDFVVKLSNDRHVIIDSKAPLDALWDSYDTDDESVKSEALNRHVTAVKQHVSTLAKRDYTGNRASMLEYTIMVVPEYALLPALKHEGELIEYALDKHVILVTHSILMVLLRAIELVWKHSELADNVKEIGDMSTEVYEQLCNFTTHYLKTGKSLDEAVKAFNKGTQSWEKNVLPKTEKLVEISSSTKKLSDVSSINRVVKQISDASDL